MNPTRPAASASGPRNAAAATRATAAKATPAKATAAKATAAKATPAKATPAKATPAKATPAARSSAPSARAGAGAGAKLPKVLISPDGKRFEIVQVVGKALGMRSGRVGSTGKTVGRAFATVQAAKDAARARVAELTKQGFKPGSAVTGAAR